MACHVDRCNIHTELLPEIRQKILGRNVILGWILKKYNVKISCIGLD